MISFFTLAQWTSCKFLWSKMKAVVCTWDNIKSDATNGWFEQETSISTFDVLPTCYLPNTSNCWTVGWFCLEDGLNLKPRFYTEEEPPDLNLLRVHNDEHLEFATLGACWTPLHASYQVHRLQRARECILRHASHLGGDHVRLWSIGANTNVDCRSWCILTSNLSLLLLKSFRFLC